MQEYIGQGLRGPKICKELSTRYEIDTEDPKIPRFLEDLEAYINSYGRNNASPIKRTSDLLRSAKATVKAIRASLGSEDFVPEIKVHLQRLERVNGRVRSDRRTGDCGKNGNTTLDPDKVTCGLCQLRIKTGTVSRYWRGPLLDRKETDWATVLHAAPRKERINVSTWAPGYLS